LPIIRAKVALLQQRLTGGPNFAGCLAPGLSVDAGCADPPMIVVPRGRATGPANNQTLGKLDIERQVQQALWAPGDTLLGFVRPGAWYFDATIDSPTGSGHADHSDQGARRVGRRMACDWVAAFTVDRPINRGPEWGTPRFDGPVCTVPLAYIGVGLTLTTAGNPAALNEWYVGDATRLGSIIDNGVFATAAIRADGLAVTLTRASGSWLGSEVIRYLVGAPGASTGQVVAPPSLVYDGRGGFGGFEPGLPAAPRFA
jgi:hypothetical protein